jgi:hypothetical protein
MKQMGKIGIDYMSYRLLNPKLPLSPTWDGIRRIAARLAIEDQNNSTGYETYIRLLCSRATYGDHANFAMAAICMGRLGPDDMPDNEYSEHEYEYDLMAAAAYTNKLSIIEELSADPNLLGIRIVAFGNPYLVAVVGGNAAALDLLFEKRHECSPYRLKHSMSENVDSVKRMILRNVALHGHPSMVHKCLPKWRPNHFTKWRKDRLEELEHAMTTPCVETFDMIMRERGSTQDASLTGRQLAHKLWLACWEG